MGILTPICFIKIPTKRFCKYQRIANGNPLHVDGVITYYAFLDVCLKVLVFFRLAVLLFF